MPNQTISRTGDPLSFGPGRRHRMLAVAAALAVAVAGLTACGSDQENADQELSDNAAMDTQTDTQSQSTPPESDPTQASSSSDTEEDMPADAKKETEDGMKGQPQSGGSSSSSLMSMKGQEIVGRQIMTSDGQPAGEISELVVGKQQKQLFAVLATAGSSSKKVVLPLRGIELKQGELQSKQNMDEIKQAKTYSASDYEPIALDQPISASASG